VCEHPRKVENKKESNEVIGKFVDGMATMRSDLHRCNCHIAALEDTKRKLRAVVANAITQPYEPYNGIK
jgi:hypothetical protein